MTHPSTPDTPNGQRPPKPLIAAVNELFTKFQVAYPNQYYKAYPDAQKLALAKQLWLRSLANFSAEKIVRATQRAIERNDFIPSIAQVIKYIENDFEAYGLPEPRAAYREACLAPSPKGKAKWSHPAVYHAGKLTDWFVIATSTEKTAYPIFERNYRILCERVFAGDQLDLPVAEALPEDISTPLSAAEKQEEMKALRKRLGL